MLANDKLNNSIVNCMIRVFEKSMNHTLWIQAGHH